MNSQENFPSTVSKENFQRKFNINIGFHAELGTMIKKIVC
jgi:hypothetical protein